jgi:hypothetical protein
MAKKTAAAGVSSEELERVVDDDEDNAPAAATEDGDDAVVEEDFAPEPDDATEEPADPAPAASDPTPAGQEAAEAAAAAGAATAAAAATPEPTGLTRPEDAQPWGFRVDRTDVQVDGAWLSPDGKHIIIPKDVWDQHIQRRWVANRDEWRHKETQYHNRFAELESTVGERERAANALLARVNDILESPETLQAFAADFAANRAALIAQAERDSLAARMAEYEAEKTEREEAERIEREIVPRMQADLAHEFADALRDPTLAILAEDRAKAIELLRELYYQQGRSLFWEAKTDDPIRGVTKGQIGVDRTALHHELTRRAQHVQLERKRVQDAAAAAARNKEALQPKPPATQPRTGTPRSTATRTSTSPKPDTTPLVGAAARRAVRDELRNTNWLDDDEE